MVPAERYVGRHLNILLGYTTPFLTWKVDRLRLPVFYMDLGFGVCTCCKADSKTLKNKRGSA